MAKNKKNLTKPTFSLGLPWRISRMIFGLFLVMIACTFVILMQSVWKIYPVSGQHQLLIINKGDSYGHFIQQLKEKQIIQFSWAARVYQKFFIHDSLKAGVYQIEQGIRVWQVLDLLSDANNAQMNRIAIIEGTTFKQLEKKLKQDRYVSIQCLNQPTEVWLKQIGATETHPEGLFAPNTYFFAKGEADCNILKTLYQKQTQALDSAWQHRAEHLPYKTPYEALIMASIVEKETSVNTERQQVAGVFVRRLNIGMRLQTDPTVIYGMGDSYEGNIRRKDLLTPTIYNTYTIKGLPPTPIALPSERSIYAALHPDHANSLYFVATGHGGHTFSDTLEQHNRAVQQYLAVIKAKQQDQTRN